MLEDYKRIITEGTGIPLPGNDIDTDRIIPARFMKCVTFDNLGEYAFYDERFDENHNLRKHSLNDEKYKNGVILIVNKNFGCGSSREHAPQSLLRYGIKAIIGESFAEIFAGNCTTLGIPAVTANEDKIKSLMIYIENNPGTKITIDLDKKEIIYNDHSINAEMPKPARFALVNGTWDSTKLLLESKNDIDKKMSTIPYLQWEINNGAE